jgi:hypothetical protein
MNKTLSLLQNYKADDLRVKPFPYLVIENALPDSICEELLSTYPSPEIQGVDQSRNNLRWSTKARDLPKISGLASIWTEIIAHHTSQAFLDEVLNVFQSSLLSMYTHHFPNADSLLGSKAVTRDISTRSKGALALDAQISGNTPTTLPSAPRGVHFDSPNALYGGLYYLRDHQDDSVGGDLQIWKWAHSYNYRKKSGEYREAVPRKHVELVEIIPYKLNTFVLFINSIDSLHSVTVRQPTKHTRKFINLLADSDSNYFSLNPYPHARIRNALRRRFF